MLHQIEEAWWKDLLQLTEQHRCRFFQVLSDGPRYLLGTKLAKEKSSTLPALAKRAQGHSLRPSLEEAVESICGSHDSSSR